MIRWQLQVALAALVAGCATTPATTPCSPRGFSCRGRQPSEPLKVHEPPDSQAVVYRVGNGVEPEQAATALCEQVLSPFGSASVLGEAVSVQDAVGAHELARDLLRNVASAQTPKSAGGGGLSPPTMCAAHSFTCRGRQPSEPTKAKEPAEPLTLVYPIATDLPPEQVANTLCEQVLSPFGSASVLGRAVSVQDTPGTHERVKLLFLNVDKPVPAKN